MLDRFITTLLCGIFGGIALGLTVTNQNWMTSAICAGVFFVVGILCIPWSAKDRVYVALDTLSAEAELVAAYGRELLDEGYIEETEWEEKTGGHVRTSRDLGEAFQEFRKSGPP